MSFQDLLLFFSGSDPFGHEVAVGFAAFLVFSIVGAVVVVWPLVGLWQALRDAIDRRPLAQPTPKPRPPPVIQTPAFDDHRDWNGFLRNEPLPGAIGGGTHGTARVASLGEVARCGGFASSGIPLGAAYDAHHPTMRFTNNVGPQLRDDGEGHLLLCAPTGGGKATDVLLPALLDPSDTGNWFIVDPKCQLATITRHVRNQLGRNAYYLNPFDLFSERLGLSVGHNPMASLNPDSPSYGADCDGIADGCILPTGGDAHWPEGAQMFLSGLVMYFRKYGAPEEQNLVAVADAIGGSRRHLQSIIDDALLTGDALITQRLSRFEDLNNDRDSEVRGLVSSAQVQLKFIGNAAIRKSLTGSFRFTALRERKGRSVFLILPGKYLDTCGKWFRLIVASAMRELMVENPGERVTFLLDEFAQLGKLSILETAVAMARGYGLKLFPVVQDLKQLRKLYGDGWETFLANTATQIFYPPLDQFTAEYLSRYSGTRTVMAPSYSSSSSSSHSSTYTATLQGGSWSSGTNSSTNYSAAPAGRPLFTPEEIRGLPPTASMIFKARIAAPILAIRTPYWRIPALRGLYLKDPYYRGELPQDYQSVDMLPPPMVAKDRRVIADARDLSQASAKGRPRITPAQGGAVFGTQDFLFWPRALIEGTVRLLSKQSYTDDGYASVSPLDFAVAWGPMSDRAALRNVTVSQANRWFSWRGWVNGLRTDDIVACVANWHLVPASAHILNTLKAAQPGALVTLRGKLVDIERAGLIWSTSLVLGDSGEGACEIIWVEAVQVS